MKPGDDRDSRYLIGIDLGTTHTVAAYTDTKSKNRQLRLFEIDQLVAPGEIAAKPMLASMRYHPADGEIAPEDIKLPWPTPADETIANAIIGELARQLGSKTLGRLVRSAKSWLSHASVDRNAAILPWGSADATARISPVDACASYVGHLRLAWNNRFKKYPLEEQIVVVTIPASFDESARALTVEALRRAGLDTVSLLEEPQAVCYEWLWRHKNRLKKSLTGIRLLLVCDVGGGTTDFTLIKIESEDNEPRLTRIGVGDHLMLGGDNIDLTLARLVENRLPGSKQALSAADLSQLIEQCRAAKESLLEDESPNSAKITLLGSGARVIGGARTAELEKDEVVKTVLDGFFPLTRFDDLPERKRSGVVEFGLPYSAEPAISNHIAAFLNRHLDACREALGEPSAMPLPDAVLVNGGSFNSPAIRKRLVALVRSWGRSDIRMLDNKQPDLAVALGAVAYGLAQRGEQIKIGGGSARAYFLLIDGENNKQKRGVCLLPLGTEEETEIILPERTFLLRLAQPVGFNLASSTDDSHYLPGDVETIDAERFISLPPLAVALDKQNESGDQTVKVKLAATLTEVGTLNLQCIAAEDSAQRWSVEFQIRQKSMASGAMASASHPKLMEAAASIQRVFGTKSTEVSPKAVKGLRAHLEKTLGPRPDWDSGVLRELFGILLEGIKRRRRSADHERIWLSLSGYCLRPGFGAPLDDWRIEQIWPIYSQRIQYVNHAQNWAEWWTFWRRVAGGLDENQQRVIYDDLAKYINPASARQGSVANQLKKRGYEDMVRLVAVLEHLPVERKIELGRWLLKRLKKASEPDQSWWALGRIGARLPFHGSAHNVVPPDIAADWIQQMFGHDWKKKIHIGFAATLIARMSGDRNRDIDSALRSKFLERLQTIKAPISWINMIERVTELDQSDTKRVFGEALPPGLLLLD